LIFIYYYLYTYIYIYIYFIFKKNKLQVRKWRREFRTQERQIDRQINSITMEENKIKASLKQAAKRGDKKICISLAKEIINSRNAKNKLYETKAQLNSILMSLQQQLCMFLINNK